MDQAILRRAHSAQTHIDSRLSSFPSPSPPICTLPTPISLPLTQLNRLSPVTDVGQPHSRSQFYIETCSLCLSVVSSLTLLPLFHLFYMHFFLPLGPFHCTSNFYPNFSCTGKSKEFLQKVLHQVISNYR